MKATLWKTHYFILPVSFKQHNDNKSLYRWAKIVFFSISNLSRDALLFVTKILGQIAILWKFRRRSLESFTRSQ